MQTKRPARSGAFCIAAVRAACPGERENPIMGAQAATLSEDDIKALAT
jgi:cytochrome c553